MASRTANTPTELWPKVIGLLADIKMVAAEQGSQRDIVKALELETEILKYMGEPVDQMSGSAGMAGAGGSGGLMPPPSAAGSSPFRPGMGGRSAAAATSPNPRPYGAPGQPGGAPNMDELRRILPG